MDGLDACSAGAAGSRELVLARASQGAFRQDGQAAPVAPSPGSFLFLSDSRARLAAGFTACGS